MTLDVYADLFDDGLDSVAEGLERGHPLGFCGATAAPARKMML